LDDEIPRTLVGKTKIEQGNPTFQMKNENTFNIFIKLRSFGIKKSCSKLRDMPSACLPCFSWFLTQSTGQTCYTVPNSTRGSPKVAAVV